MCFYADYDWYAAVSEETEGPSPERTHCNECGRVIHAGEWRHHLHQEQYECCLACDPDDPDGREPNEDGSCDHGETADFTTCGRCHALRAAVRAVEEHEGCVGAEAEPPRGVLFDAIHDAGGWDEYVPKMLALGHAAAVATIEAPDPDDVWWDNLGDEYPGWWQDGDDGRDRDFGGEGG